MMLTNAMRLSQREKNGGGCFAVGLKKEPAAGA